MTQTIERRTFLGEVEFRAADDGQIRAIGYAAKFNTNSQNLGGFVEQVAPGAFAKTLQEADVRGLLNHDPNFVLGRNTSETLRMEEDGTGLRYEIDLPDTSAGRDVATLLERKDITGSSFGFRTIEDEWSETEGGFPLRTLKSVALRDVGPVTFPAYTDSESALRCLAEARSLDLADLVEAAEKNNLREMIAERSSEENNEEEERDESQGRETPTPARRKFLHLI